MLLDVVEETVVWGSNGWFSVMGFGSGIDNIVDTEGKKIQNFKESRPK